MVATMSPASAATIESSMRFRFPAFGTVPDHPQRDDLPAHGRTAPRGATCWLPRPPSEPVFRDVVPHQIGSRPQHRYGTTESADPKDAAVTLGNTWIGVRRAMHAPGA